MKVESKYMVCVRHTNCILAVYRPLFWSMRQPIYEVITFSNTLIEAAIPLSQTPDRFVHDTENAGKC